MCFLLLCVYNSTVCSSLEFQAFESLSAAMDVVPTASGDIVELLHERCMDQSLSIRKQVRNGGCSAGALLPVGVPVMVFLPAMATLKCHLVMPPCDATLKGFDIRMRV